MDQLPIKNLTEEEIRASERERIAAFLAKGGIEPDYLYQATNAKAAWEIQNTLPDIIRGNVHSMSYAEYRQDCDPAWPEGYQMQPEDYDFDVYKKPYE